MRLRELLPAFAYDRPVAMLMGFLALLVVGLIAWVRIPLQMLPSGFEPRTLWVQVPYRNASPVEIDEAVVRPIEDELGTVGGIQSLRSTAGDGRASFDIEFYGSVSMDDAYNAVVDRLERAMARLPSDADRYFVYKYSPGDEPIIWAGVSFPDSVDDPYHVMTRVVQPRLERIAGVASLDVWGVPQRLVYVDWDRDRLLAHHVDLADVERRLQADNFERPGGRVADHGRTVNVRSLSKIDDVDELRRWPVSPGVTLADVADVEVRAAADAAINRIDGQNAAALAVHKESTANTVDVAKAVDDALSGLETDPRTEGAKFHVFFDQGDLISQSVGELEKAAVEGGVFAVIVLLLFLREWRMTLLIALAIPFSLLVTVAVLWLEGRSLNLLSLMGLMLSVGMVVDNAIVVVETIYRRRMMGADARAAAVEGTAEVNLAIVLSTLTSIVVFLPIILMSGDAKFGFFMTELGMPVILTHVAALGAALLLAPLATRYVGAARIRPDPRWLERLTNAYERALAWVLAHRADSAAMLFALSFLTIVLPVRGVDCTGDADSNLNDFDIRFTVPPQASPADRDAIVGRFEKVVEDNRDRWGVRVYRARLGARDDEGEVSVFLVADGPMTREQAMDDARKRLPDDVPGVKGSIGWSDSGGGGGNSVTLALYGDDMDTLDAIGREVIRRAETVDGVLGAKLSFAEGGADEVRLRIDRQQASRWGLSAGSIGQVVAFAMRGAQLEPIVQGDRSIDVVTRFAEEDRADLASLLDLPVGGAAMPLRALADVEVGKGPSSIVREDRRMASTVEIDLAKDADPDEVWPRVAAVVGAMELPHGVSWSRADDNGVQMEEDHARNLALVLSIVFVFLIMGTLFESFLMPLAIITTVPMALVGTFWGLWSTGTPFDMMSGVGLVILVGIVVNNGIVLVDLVGQLRAEGVPRDEALLRAGTRRMRPILMTALCTIIGLVPMAFGTSTFIGIPYAPLGRTVMSGMIASTFLTLLFVPFLYAVLDDLRTSAGRWTSLVRAAAVAGLALVVLLPSVARAERPLTYDEAVSGALQSNPAAGEASFVRAQAEGDLLSTWGAFDPIFSADTSWARASSKGYFQGLPASSHSRDWQLDASLDQAFATGTTWGISTGFERRYERDVLTFGGVDNESVVDDYRSSLDLTLSQQVLKGSRLSYNLQNTRTAGQRLDEAKASEERARQEAVSQAASAYWNWVYLERRWEIAQDAVKAADEALRVGQLRVKAGSLAPIEQTRLEAALVQEQSAELDARVAARQAADQLLLLMGEDPGQDVLPATQPGDAPPISIDAAKAVEVGLSGNLDLAVARSQLQEARIDLLAAKQERQAQLALTGAAGVGARGTTAGHAIGNLFGSAAYPEGSVGASVSVPIGNRAARGGYEAAEARVHERELAVDDLQRQISAQIEHQVRVLEQSQRRVELADANAKLADETLAAETSLQSAGRAIEKDVLEARTAAEQARADAVKARTDYRLAEVELLRLQGQLDAGPPP